QLRRVLVLLGLAVALEVDGQFAERRLVFQVFIDRQDDGRLVGIEGVHLDREDEVTFGQHVLERRQTHDDCGPRLIQQEQEADAQDPQAPQPGNASLHGWYLV